MRFKLILALVKDTLVDKVLDAAREAGATGSTVITNARGEGLIPQKTFFGLDLVAQRDIVLLVVEEQHSDLIMQRIADAGEFDARSGAGIAFQIDIEKFVGLESQIDALKKRQTD